MENISFQIQLNNSGIVNTNSNVIFDNLISSFGDITYNGTTGEIAINKTGKYYLNWWVATQSSMSTNGAVFSIKSSSGNPIIGDSPLKTGQVNGNAVLNVTTVPTTIYLVNSSNSDFYYSTIVPIKASLVVVEEMYSPAYGAFKFDADETGGYIPQNTDIIFSQVIGVYQNLGFTPGQSNITIQQNGIYRVEFAIKPIYQSGQTISIRVNGTDVTYASRYNDIDGADRDYSIVSFLELNTGDNVSVHIAGEAFLNISMQDPLANLYIMKIA